MAHNPRPQQQSAAIVQMPREAMQRAAALVKGGVYTPPYPWDTPPPGHVPRHIQSSVVAPAYGQANQVEILNFQVPAGMFFVIKAMLIRYDGTNFVPGSGDVVFTVDLNNPQTLGQTGNFGMGRAIPDYGQYLFNLGSFDFGPAIIWGSPVLLPNERLGIKGYTVANVGTGTRDTRFSAQVMGWEWSATQ
jgi:hypothetical protein